MSRIGEDGVKYEEMKRRGDEEMKRRRLNARSAFCVLAPCTCGKSCHLGLHGPQIDWL